MTRLAELSEEAKKCLEDPDSRSVYNSLSGLDFCKPVLVMFCIFPMWIMQIIFI